MPKCDLNKVAIEITFRDGYSPVNQLHFLRTPLTPLDGCFCEFCNVDKEKMHLLNFSLKLCKEDGLQLKLIVP